MQPQSTWNKQWHGTASGVRLSSPPHFKWATTRMRLRASLHCVFSTLMCFLNERRESHHSPRNFVDSTTGRSVSPIPIIGGLWARDCGAVKCMTLHLWAANLKPFLIAHSSMALTACCRCLSMVSRERNALLLCLTRFWSWFAVGEIRRRYIIWGSLV